MGIAGTWLLPGNVTVEHPTFVAHTLTSMLMKQKIEVIHKTRQFILNVIQDLSIEQLNHIPEGFSNNIIWNLGHMIAAQQGVCYLRTELPARVSMDFFHAYKPGSKPEKTLSVAAVDEIKDLLFSTPDQLLHDYENGLWTNYKPWTTRYGVELTTIEDAVEFLLFHEGLHSGYITALKRVVEQQPAKL